MYEEIKVAILDDHPFIIDGYISILEKTDHIKVVGTAGTGERRVDEGVFADALPRRHPADADAGAAEPPGFRALLGQRDFQMAPHEDTQRVIRLPFPDDCIAGRHLPHVCVGHQGFQALLAQSLK